MKHLLLPSPYWPVLSHSLSCSLPFAPLPAPTVSLTRKRGEPEYLHWRGLQNHLSRRAAPLGGDHWTAREEQSQSECPYSQTIGLPRTEPTQDGPQGTKVAGLMEEGLES